MSATRQTATDFKVVVVLASLGGLEALSTLLEGLPGSFDTPLILLQHGRADPHHRDRLARLLQARTSLPVTVAADGVTAMAGVTIVPAGFSATLSSTGRVTMLVAATHGGGDVLFRAAAAAFGPRAIAVVLTGRLRDGAQGVQAIKRRGGRVLAQHPTGARAAGMPSAAIATGCVDHVLPLERIAPALVALTMAPGGADLLAVPTPHWAMLET